MPTNEDCACCGHSLRHAREIGSSSLYFPNGYDVDLCMDCFWAEEALQEESGTNDHPERLAQYLRNLGHRRAAERVLQEAKEWGRILQSNNSK